MEQPISIEKLFEMYGHVSIERDMLREQIVQLHKELVELKQPGNETIPLKMTSSE